MTRSALRHLVQFIDKDRTLLRQIIHNVAVVHNLLADVDRRAKDIERDLHDVDRTHDASAEASRLQQQHALGCLGAIGRGRIRCIRCFYGIEGGCRHIIQYTVLEGVVSNFDLGL